MTPEEGNRLGIINKSTLWYQKKNLAQVKKPNFHQCFPKSRQANKVSHNVHWSSKG